MKKLVFIFSLFIATLMIATACDSLPFVALNSATDTPTRTPRPTFTPRASATDTPAESQTPVETAVETAVDTEVPPASDTPEVQEPDTPTKKPAATRKPTSEPATPQPTTPQFAVHSDFGGANFCQQDGIYEIVIYIKKDGGAPRPFADGLFYGVFSGGQLLKDGAGHDLIGTTDVGSISYGSNCKASYDRLHPNQSNGKLDVSDVVRRGTTRYGSPVHPFTLQT